MDRPRAGQVRSGTRPDALSDDGALRAAGAILATSRSVVVLTGAGISTDSGIPDFRGPNGLWTTSGRTARPWSLEAYLADEEGRRRAWCERLAAPIWRAKPNRGHGALLELERSGRLELLVTQNTDGLHHAAGHAPERLVELHGSVHRTLCLRCGRVVSTREVLERVRAGEDDPRCLEELERQPCGGVLKVATVGFGQPLDPLALRAAAEAVARCDLLLAVGTTLRVDPAASLAPLAKRLGAALVLVNGAPTRHDDLADVIVHAPIGDALPRLVALGGHSTPRPEAL